MVNYYSQTFSADDETIQIIKKVRSDLKISKSEIIRCLFKYFNTHFEQLEKILRGD